MSARHDRVSSALGTAALLALLAGAPLLAPLLDEPAAAPQPLPEPSPAPVWTLGAAAWTAQPMAPASPVATAHQVPEPGTVSLSGLALAAAVARRRVAP